MNSNQKALTSIVFCWLLLATFFLIAKTLIDGFTLKMFFVGAFIWVITALAYCAIYAALRRSGSMRKKGEPTDRVF